MSIQSAGNRPGFGISARPNSGESALSLDFPALSNSLKGCQTADFKQYLTVSVPEPDAKQRSRATRPLPQNSECQSCLCLRMINA